MIIGIGGYKGVGKTTASKVFIENNFVPLSFADPLKRICASVVATSFKTFDDPIFKDTKLVPKYAPKGLEFADKIIEHLSLYEVLSKESELKIKRLCLAKEFESPREVIQFIGTDIGRNCVGQSFWTDVFLKEISQYGDKDIVVADIRFPNERDVIKSLGGKLIRIDRPGNGPGNHASENQIGDVGEYDAVFVNDKNIEELFVNVRSWYVEIKGSK